MLLFNALVPVLPGRRPQLLGGCAMTGKLRNVHRVSRTGEALGDVAHLYWRAAKPVDQKHAFRPSSNAKASIGHLHPAFPD